MTSKQKITSIRKLLSVQKIATELHVSVTAVQSWTKSQKGARVPWGKNADKIDGLYDFLKPCFDQLETLNRG